MVVKCIPRSCARDGMFVIEVGKVRNKAKGGPVSSILMEVQGGRESLESRALDASRQWRVTRLFSVMTGISTCPAGIGIVPHTEIEMDSKVGFTTKRSKKGDNDNPGMIMLRDLREENARSLVSKKGTSRERDCMVDISPKSGGRSGNCPDDELVISIPTSVMTGEGIVSLENISCSP